MKIVNIFGNNHHDDVRILYIIAEAGVNHEGSMELAKRLIREAAEGGADAIKFQTYKADTIASKDSPYYWDIEKEPTKSQHELFKKYDKFWKKEFEKLKIECDEVGIEFLSTPFDRESAIFLNDLMPAFKISSSDITNKPFIELISSFGKPILLSTGASYLYEIEQAVSWIDEKNPLCLMHCILNYPTKEENANLGMIVDLLNRFPEFVIGYSDHTEPYDMKTLEIATLLGAEVLEKHFTFDKSLTGNDHYHAMDKNDLSKFVENIKRDIKLIGSLYKKPLSTEDKARRNARRSIVISGDIKKGEVFSNENLTWKRPASGISPSLIQEIIGKHARKDLKDDTILKWEMIDD